MNKAKEISALWKQIKPQIDEMVHLCYEVESHYEVTADAYQRGYEAGLNDKKEGKATCQYCEYEYLDETEEPCKKCCKAYMNKYKPKAKEEQIQVGDEVISPNGKGVVTEITDIYVRIMYAKGSGQVVKPEGLTKTGRHFPEIAEVLAKMKEADNG